MSDLPVLDKEKTEVPAKTNTEQGTKEIQIHAGNIGVVQTRLLSELNQNIARLARCAEIFIKQTFPNVIKPKVAPSAEKPKVEQSSEKSKEPNNG